VSTDNPLDLGTSHIGITVSNLERSLAFYRDILGFTLEREMERSGEYIDKMVGIPDARLRTAALSGSGYRIELVEYLSPRGEPIKSRLCDPGRIHLAFSTSNMHKVYGYLTSKGVRFTAPPQQGPGGGYAAYFVDPDGVTLELLQLKT
jgi:catechol 2,3-dioxygenase-like lactoylglutathione lyase family enzyme